MRKLFFLGALALVCLVWLAAGAQFATIHP